MLLDVPAFLDFLEVFLDVEVLASPFLFLHSNNLVKPLCSHRDFIVTKLKGVSAYLDLAGSEGGNSAPSSVGGSRHPFSI